MYAQYPNLELIEYIFKDILLKDSDWVSKIAEIKSQRGFAVPEFDVVVFHQLWGSTCTAFDVDEKGTPYIGGCAMVKAYTVVIKDVLTDTYGVFVDGRFCYMVSDANEEFLNDLKRHSIASLSKAKKRY